MNEKTRAAWKRRKGKLTADELVVWDELQALGRSKLAEAFRRQFVSKVLSADSDQAGATQYFAATRSLVQRWARCPRRKHLTLCVPRMALHRGPERGSATTLTMYTAADTQAATCSQVPHMLLAVSSTGTRRRSESRRRWLARCTATCWTPLVVISVHTGSGSEPPVAQSVTHDHMRRPQEWGSAHVSWRDCGRQEDLVQAGSIKTRPHALLRKGHGALQYQITRTLDTSSSRAEAAKSARADVAEEPAQPYGAAAPWPLVLPVSKCWHTSFRLALSSGRCAGRLR